MSRLWMAIDLNDNELPLAVADTAKKLAEMCGVTENAIHCAISNAKKGGWRCRYVKVEIDDD